MNFTALNNAVIRMLVGAIFALFIINGNIIRAQSDAVNIVESANGKKGVVVGSVSLGGRPFDRNPVTVQLYDPAARKIFKSLNISIRESISVFSFDEVTPGNYIIYIEARGFIKHLAAVSVKEGINEIGEQLLERIPLIFTRGVGVNMDSGEIRDFISPEYEAFLKKYPRIGNYSVLTVCDYLKMEPVWRQQAGSQLIIIGNLVQRSEGSWLEQPCGNPIKSGDHIWPDAVFLNFISNPPYLKSFIDGHDDRLKEAIDRYGKDFIQNNNSGNNVAVAVIGSMVTFENLVYVKCGEEKHVVSGTVP